ncbi:hypothetical protein FOL46_001595, partial [Perkinsus olseni]
MISTAKEDTTESPRYGSMENKPRGNLSKAIRPLNLHCLDSARSRDPPPSSHDLPRPKRASTRGTLDGFAILEATGAAKLPEDVMSVSLASRQLKTVVTKDLVYFRNLDTLDLSDNRLSSPEMLLKLTVFTRLIKLNMAHNCVASIPVHLAASPNDFPFLTDLNLSHNDLVQYDQWKPLEGLPRLETLSLAHNRIRFTRALASSIVYDVMVLYINLVQPCAEGKRVEPIDGVTEEARSKRVNDVFRTLKWLDLSGNELRDLPRLQEHLSMLTGACDKAVVVK